MYFRGKYDFLSNFYTAPFSYDGLTYQCAEAAFQAAKITDNEARKGFTKMNGAEAKKTGKRVMLRSDWETVKYEVMRDVIWAKFTQNADIMEKLLTIDEEIVEENNWGDKIWGVCNGVGANWLGKILMETRDIIKAEQQGILPLTPEEIMKMHGKPVFIKQLGQWGLIEIRPETKLDPETAFVHILTGVLDLSRRQYNCYTHEI